MIDHSDTEAVVEQCFNEISAASREAYNAEKADRTAALFLTAQMKLSFLIEDVELAAKQAKNEIVRIEGEKYFECKEKNIDKKITEATLTNYVAKHSDIVNAKIECAKQEAALKKWSYILSSLKDGHIYFRNLTREKSWQN